MSGECDECDEHALECKCKKERPYNACDYCASTHTWLYAYNFTDKTWLCNECFDALPEDFRSKLRLHNRAKAILDLYNKPMKENE